MEQPGRGGVCGWEAANALSDYKRAIKLNKHKAVFHANLANAYFENKDYHGARQGDCSGAGAGSAGVRAAGHGWRSGACAVVEGSGAVLV